MAHLLDFPRLENGWFCPKTWVFLEKILKTALKYHPQWFGTLPLCANAPSSLSIKMSFCLLQDPSRVEKHSWLGKLIDSVSLFLQMNLVEGNRKKGTDICWELSLGVLCLLPTSPFWVGRMNQITEEKTKTHDSDMRTWNLTTTWCGARPQATLVSSTLVTSSSDYVITQHQAGPLLLCNFAGINDGSFPSRKKR